MGHLTEELIRIYREKTWTPEQLAEIDDHTAECAVCRQALTTPERDAAITRSVERSLGIRITPTGSHLTEEQIVDLVDNSLSAKEKSEAEIHLQTCSYCREAVRDLRKFAEIPN